MEPLASRFDSRGRGYCFMKAASSSRLISVLLCSLAIFSCNQNPEVVKRKYMEGGDKYSRITMDGKYAYITWSDGRTGGDVDGILLYEAMAVLFVAQVYGIHLTIGQQLLTAVSCLFAGVGIAARFRSR